MIENTTKIEKFLNKELIKKFGKTKTVNININEDDNIKNMFNKYKSKYDFENAYIENFINNLINELLEKFVKENEIKKINQIQSFFFTEIFKTISFEFKY